MRGLVPFEIAMVLALAVVPLPEPIPIAIPLIVVASLARWIRGASWSDVGAASGFGALVGLGAGIAGLVLALIAGAPLVEAMTSRVVEWSTNAVVRGNFAMLGGVVIFAAMASACMEVALRGWIVERVLDLSSRSSFDSQASFGSPASLDSLASHASLDTRASPASRASHASLDSRRGALRSMHVVLAILVGAFAEAILTPGDLTVRVGAAIWGIGFGWIYVAAGRNVIVPMLARMTFTVVLVILEGIRVV
jgi:hypothetical protein